MSSASIFEPRAANLPARDPHSSRTGSWHDGSVRAGATQDPPRGRWSGWLSQKSQKNVSQKWSWHWVPRSSEPTAAGCGEGAPRKDGRKPAGPQLAPSAPPGGERGGPALSERPAPALPGRVLAQTKHRGRAHVQAGGGQPPRTAPLLGGGKGRRRPGGREARGARPAAARAPHPRVPRSRAWGPRQLNLTPTPCPPSQLSCATPEVLLETVGAGHGPPEASSPNALRASGIPVG